jgi:hypothetical protein
MLHAKNWQSKHDVIRQQDKWGLGWPWMEQHDEDIKDPTRAI